MTKERNRGRGPGLLHRVPSHSDTGKLVKQWTGDWPVTPGSVPLGHQEASHVQMHYFNRQCFLLNYPRRLIPAVVVPCSGIITLFGNPVWILDTRQQSRVHHSAEKDFKKKSCFSLGHFAFPLSLLFFWILLLTFFLLTSATPISPWPSIAGILSRSMVQQLSSCVVVHLSKVCVSQSLLLLSVIYLLVGLDVLLELNILAT